MFLTVTVTTPFVSVTMPATYAVAVAPQLADRTPVDSGVEKPGSVPGFPPIKSEYAKYGKLVRDVGLKPQ